MALLPELRRAPLALDPPTSRRNAQPNELGAAVDLEVDGAVVVVAARNQCALDVDHAHHRSARENTQRMLDGLGAAAGAVDVDETAIERIGRIELEVDLGDLIAHRTEHRHESPPRLVVFDDELTNDEPRSRVGLALHDRPRPVGHRSRVARRDEPLATLVGEARIPQRHRPLEHPRPSRAGTGVKRLDGRAIVPARRADLEARSARTRAPLFGDRLRRD